MIIKEDLIPNALGKRFIPSPLELSVKTGDGYVNYVSDKKRVLYNVIASNEKEFNYDLTMEHAGPREKIYFNPSQTKAAIVTCGGLCPGLNNVIRSIFLELHYKYNVSEVFGIRYGFKGLNPVHGFYPLHLTVKNVDGINKLGGSILGSSRGSEPVEVMVDTLEEMGVNILFCIGGDGTLRGAHAIWEEIEKRNKKISVIGVPKTIDNDINFVYKTFGFDTAVGVARDVLESAHVEANGTPNGIGLVKVMGRDAGFIACHASISNLEVNFCLIPEIPFDMEGKGAFLDVLEERLKARSHAVIVVAEGAGQDLIKSGNRGRDASGNIKYKDIGQFLSEEIRNYFKKKNFTIDLKYIDPSYSIRSVPANASDSIFCDNLARNAVHAGMAGKTDIVIGLWHGVYVHVPISLTVKSKKCVSPESTLWRHLLEATGQPDSIKKE